MVLAQRGGCGGLTREGLTQIFGGDLAAGAGRLERFLRQTSAFPRISGRTASRRTAGRTLILDAFDGERGQNFIGTRPALLRGRWLERSESMSANSAARTKTACMGTLDRIAAAIDQISIWSGKIVSWLIFPMFLVLFYEVLVAQVLVPDDLGQRHRHDVLRRAFLSRRRLHALSAEAHPHRFHLAEMVAQDAGAHGHRAVPAAVPARHDHVHVAELGLRGGVVGAARSV